MTTDCKDTTPLSSAGQGSSLQAQRPANTPIQEPLYPPGLGLTPLFRRAAICGAIESWRTSVVGDGYGSILLDGLSVGLGLYGPNATTTSATAQTTRRDVPSDLEIPATTISDLPPQEGRHEGMVVLPGPWQLSMSPDEFALWIANLERFVQERERAKLLCPLCCYKASTMSGTQCDVESVDPIEFMDFRFLDEDDYYFSLVPSPSPTPPVREDGSVPRSWKENRRSPSLEEHLDSLCFVKEELCPGNPQDSPCPMKNQWFREGLTSEDIYGLWCDGHIPRPIRVKVSTRSQGRTEEHLI